MPKDKQASIRRAQARTRSKRVRKAPAGSATTGAAQPASPGPYIVNVDEVTEDAHFSGDHWGHAYKILTPSMSPAEGRLSVNLTRLPPGRTAVPFHYHQREDEVFFVMSGNGVLRYGESLRSIRPGDCIACPAGTGIAHQIANTSDEDLVYLAIGPNDPDEVCFYPDTGKVLVRNLHTVGYLEKVAYDHGEPELPKVFELIKHPSTRPKARQKKAVGAKQRSPKKKRASPA